MISSRGLTDIRVKKALEMYQHEMPLAVQDISEMTDLGTTTVRNSLRRLYVGQIIYVVKKSRTYFYGLVTKEQRENPSWVKQMSEIGSYYAPPLYHSVLSLAQPPSPATSTEPTSSAITSEE